MKSVIHDVQLYKAASHGLLMMGADETNRYGARWCHGDIILLSTPLLDTIINTSSLISCK